MQISSIVNLAQLVGERLKARKRPPPRESPRNYYEITGETSLSFPRFAVVGRKVPFHHTIRRGDTMWDLCGLYFNNPWLWPKVWSYNPIITNPHWIYPGFRMRLRRTGGHSAQPALRAYSSTPSRPQMIYLNRRGFIEEGALKYKAKIVGSREEKILLSTHDQIYIKYNANKPLKVGGRYSVYKEVKKVKHPHNKRLIGKMVEIFGKVEIKELSKANVARGEIIKAVGPIERGYLVGNLKRTFKVVKPIKNTRTKVSGSVIAVLQRNHVIGTKQLIFIDRGKKYKVKKGYTFYVTRRGDAYRRVGQFIQKPDPKQRNWPKELVAQIVIIDVDWDHSVGYVTKALKEIRIGDRVELLVGKAKAKASPKK
jgi:hypothetical protein